MSTNQTTTNPSRKKRRRPSSTGALKAILAAGALMTTLIGADLLATQEQPATIVSFEPTANMVVVVPEMKNESFSTTTTAPVTQLTIPQPVAKSKSSA